jgi:hypothetical protein
MARRPADPEEELRWMSQEVRGYVEAVLNSLAANVPKVCTRSFSWFFEPCDLWSNVLLSFAWPGYCTLPSGEIKRRYAKQTVQLNKVGSYSMKINRDSYPSWMSSHSFSPWFIGNCNDPPSKYKTHFWDGHKD